MNLEINKRVVHYRRQNHLTQSEVAERIEADFNEYSCD